MKFKYFLVALLGLAAMPAFAESPDKDIYEDDGVYAKPSVQQGNSGSKAKSYAAPKTSGGSSTSSSKSQFPRFEGQILAEYYVDTLVHSKDEIRRDDNKTNSYLYAESILRLRITEGFFAETKWFLRPVNDRLYTGDYYADNQGYVVDNSLNSDFYGKEDYVRRKFQFDKYGLGVETLNVGYKNTNLAVAIGKIDPSFGSAFDRSRFSGIYGILIPQEYQLTEKIGGYVAALLPFGNIQFNLFYDDVSGLSNTMFKSRGRDKSKGGAGNTEKFDNFSITFDGKLDNLSFNVGFRYLDVDYANQEPEKGYVVGAEYLFELEYGINFLPFVEFAYFDNFDGMKSRDVYYLTAFLPIIIENWHFIASSTMKFDDEKHYHSYTTHLTQLSVGYKFDFGLMIDAARVWERYVKKADGFSGVGPKDKWVRHADSWVFMVSYLFEF